MRSVAGQRVAPPAPAARGAPACDPPWVVVHDAAQAGAALAAAGPRGVGLLSAPGAAGYLGAPLFLALVAAAAASHPGKPYRAALDCGDQPGHALAALRAGLRLLVLDPAVPAFPTVAAAAAELGAALWGARPPALDLGQLALGRPAGQRRLTLWLQGAADDSAGSLG